MRVAVVGTGYWGRNHVRIWRELQDEGKVDEVVLFDKSKETAAQMSKDFGVPIAEDLDTILQGRYHAVDLITPTATHSELGLQIMRSGKDLFVEKPMAQTVKEAQEMIAVAKESGRILMPGHIFRYHGALKALRKMISRGDFGDIMQIHTQRSTLRIPRSDMGVLLALGIHDVDIYAWLMDAPPSSIYCETHENWIEGIEDTAFMRMSWPDGAVGYIHESWSHPVDDKVRTLSVIGRRMSARIDYLRPNEIMVYDRRIDEGETLSLKDEGHRVEMVPYEEPLKAEIMDFLHSVGTLDRPSADMYVGLRAIEMIEAAMKSAKKGKPVDFKPE